MEHEKYVDEFWKESATEEKAKLKDNIEPTPQQQQADHAGEVQQPEETAPQKQASEEVSHDGLKDLQINFMNYVTSLGYQALIFLGEIPNPVTNESEKNLDQARFLIDTLTMIKEKTKGNLNEQEENLINATTYELQLKYVDVEEKESKND